MAEASAITTHMTVWQTRHNNTSAGRTEFHRVSDCIPLTRKISSKLRA